MESLLNFDELSVFLSLIGGVCLLRAFRVRPSRPWEESATVKQWLLVVGAGALQLPVIAVIAFRPPWVSMALKVGEFSFGRLAVLYVVEAALVALIAFLARLLD